MRLQINDLHVKIENKPILKGVNLVIGENEIHALMGPNGNGKSTLLMTIMGHPQYKVTSGDILVDGVSVLKKTVDERSRLGMFLAMQNPVEINGLLNLDFLKSIINAHNEQPIKLFELYKTLQQSTKRLQMDEAMIKRYLNSGFSGGEKKKNEILQMSLLKPKIALIDEIDSGLDVDALGVVSEAINEQIIQQKMSSVIVSHYDRFFNLVKPTHAHVIIDGKIVISGDYKLVERINAEGYRWLFSELDLKVKDLPAINATDTIRQAGLGCSAKKAKVDE